MPVVTVTSQNEIAIVRVNNPPVNALSHAVRSELFEACESLDKDDTIKAVVLICDGRTFIAGADIREFNQAPKEPHLPDVINRIEMSTKPWIAAVHGTALGGGCEVTLGCHYRVAVKSAKFGLPEVHLGLIPGAGGTVRLPRLIGIESAISMVTTGKPISASEAHQNGLVDAVAPDGELEAFAISFTRSKMTASLPIAISRRPVTDVPDDKTSKEILAGVSAKARGQLSPVEAAASVLDSGKLDVVEAFSSERERFVQLKESEQSAALRHVFFSERQTSKIGKLEGIKTRNVQSCGVIGGGTMGAGIASAMLLAGYEVIMIERDEEAASAGAQRVAKTLDGSLSRGLISQEKRDAMGEAFSTSTQYEALTATDLVVEAVFEDMKVKKQVFRKLCDVCRPDAILATNTSYLNVNEIAASATNPERVLGLHFFSPAHIMKLVEIIETETVSDETLATGFAIAKKLRKVPVLSGVCDGFIGNRILANYRKQCDYMLEDGASPQDIDTAMRNFGMAMGPFEMQDMAGLDIGWANRKRLAPTRDPKERYVKIADRICELGRFGQKTEAGWYQYPEGSRKGIPDPVVEEIIAEERKAAGIVPRSFTMAEIQSRILQAMVSEGQKILDEGIARSAADIDMVFILGYGFPRWRGGPMFAGGVRDT
ncbi:MAG: 3-hydroxyacyl-CoA dehydrogenase NAD-binding domain-containing protein [Rhizobiaceae bacterium]|nr:3-hydroxyacyl-CoA dehydrogenase NAD-binding domain-containing protein [Rhizobiaceae bacterium]